jgi:prepilin signal peptidase PulO-like enzyme (type II secretory pathway)
LSYLIGAIVGISLIIIKKKKRQIIPFGPFLSIATIITLFYGGLLLEWYLKFGEILRGFML